MENSRNRSRNKETFYTRFVQQQKFCITRGMNDMKSQANRTSEQIIGSYSEPTGVV